MRYWLYLAGSCLLLAACAPRPGGNGPDPDSARVGAEAALVELEGGAALPLPGVSPTPEEKNLLAEGAETAAWAAEATLDYEIKPGWFLVDTTLVFPGSVAPRQAHLETLQAARAGGLERALPKEVSFTSLLSDIMDETAGSAYEKSTWSTFALSSVTGHIIDEQVISSNLTQLAAGGAYRYRIVLDARVVPVKGERDPSLRLDLKVNERLLNSGDELIISARPSRDGYLYIFNFLSDNSVMLMFPNAHLPDNAVTGGTWLEIPTVAERNRGIRYRVAAPPGVGTANETIYAVFTRRPIADLRALIDVPDGYASFSAGDDSFTDFQRWLAEIPLSQRIERAVQLHIVNDKE